MDLLKETFNSFNEVFSADKTRTVFNNYMNDKAPSKLKELFDDLDDDSGIMLQCCFEEFAEYSKSC